MSKFSIIIPCHNTFKLMGKCLDSLENQTLKDFEVIIVDDYSTDNSYDMLIDYSKKSKLNIKVYKTEANIGPGLTRNYGIDKASGEYIFMVDSDDYIETNTVELLNDVLSKNPVDCIIFDYFIEKNNKLSARDTIDYAKEGIINKSDALVFSSGSTMGKVYRTDIIKKNEVKYLDLPRSEDMPFNKIAISYCNTFYYLKSNLYHYIMHNQSIMHSVDTLDENNYIKAFEYISEKLKDKYPKEVEAIFVKEYLYGTTITLIEKKCKNKQIKQNIEKAINMYPNWKENEMICKYPKHVRICLYLIKQKNIFLLRCICALKTLLKR